MRKYLLVFWFSLSVVSVVLCQTNSDTYLKARYSFDQCDANDDTGNNSVGLVTGPECRCGVVGQSMYFDGVDDKIQMNGNVNEYFKSNNFTISLYFRPVNNTLNSVLLSKYTSCADPTGLIVRYGNRSIAVELTGESGVINSINTKLKYNTCWIHLTIVRNGTKILLYENEELIAEDDNQIRNANISNDAVLTLGMGQCSSSLDQPFKGYIDELKIYNHPLTTQQIQLLNLPVDEFITQDTVIAKGTTFEPKMAPSCANQVVWTPSLAVNPSNSFTPTIDVDTTTTIRVSYNYTDCQVEDQITVRVVDSNVIGCEDIPMPKAFTPNNDGLNDTYFIPVPASIEKLISFEIFDKWNNLIFQTSDPNEGWDGKFLDKIQNPGSFYYKIRYQCQGQSKVLSGEVLLLQ